MSMSFYMMAISADDKLVIFVLFFPENRLWRFAQMSTICMKGSNPFSAKNNENK